MFMKCDVDVLRTFRETSAHRCSLRPTELVKRYSGSFF